MLTLTQFANILRKRFPADMPIKVRVTQMPYSDKDAGLRMYGDAQENDDHYLIRINKESDICTQKETLMHEWAHCLAGWDGESNAHTKEWGIEYARIYREIIGD